MDGGLSSDSLRDFEGAFQLQALISELKNGRGKAPRPLDICSKGDCPLVPRNRIGTDHLHMDWTSRTTSGSNL